MRVGSSQDARQKLLKDPVKCWETVGARFDIKHSFGGSTLSCDSNLVPGPESIAITITVID